MYPSTKWPSLKKRTNLARPRPMLAAPTVALIWSVSGGEQKRKTISWWRSPTLVSAVTLAGFPTPSFHGRVRSLSIKRRPDSPLSTVSQIRNSHFEYVSSLLRSLFSCVDSLCANNQMHSIDSIMSSTARVQETESGNADRTGFISRETSLQSTWKWYLKAFTIWRNSKEFALTSPSVVVKEVSLLSLLLFVFRLCRTECSKHWSASFGWALPVRYPAASS